MQKWEDKLDEEEMFGSDMDQAVESEVRNIDNLAQHVLGKINVVDVLARWKVKLKDHDEGVIVDKSEEGINAGGLEADVTFLESEEDNAVDWFNHADTQTSIILLLCNLW